MTIIISPNKMSGVLGGSRSAQNLDKVITDSDSSASPAFCLVLLSMSVIFLGVSRWLAGIPNGG